MSSGFFAKPETGFLILEYLVETLEEKYLQDSAEYEQDGTAGKNYTKTEKEAGSNGKRQLTQSDPYPQTVYRVKMRPKEPMMVNISLRVIDK